MRALLDSITGALTSQGHPRELLERAAFALLDYVESSTDGFRILVRDSPVAQSTGTFASLISDAASQVEHIMANQFKERGFDPKFAPMYAQMLVGMVALTGQWWLDARRPQEGRRRRAPGQPGLERAVRPRGHAPAARRRSAIGPPNADCRGFSTMTMRIARQSAGGQSGQRARLGSSSSSRLPTGSAT